MNSLQQEVVIPIKICKKKPGSRTYFMQSKDYYVVTPLSKLLVKAHIITLAVSHFLRRHCRNFS